MRPALHLHLVKRDRWTRKLLSEQQIRNNVHAWQQQDDSGLTPTAGANQAIMPVAHAGMM